MAKFVWMTVPGGDRVPVNPDQVAYVMNTNIGPALVFGAVTGGFHQVHVAGDVAEIVAALEGRDDVGLIKVAPMAQDEIDRELAGLRAATTKITTTERDVLGKRLGEHVAKVDRGRRKP